MLANINPMFFLDLQKFHPLAFIQFQNFKDECALKDILTNIKKGKEDGFYRADIDKSLLLNYV
jgi:hypothetical protein